MAQKITNDNLQSLLEQGKPVVIDFWAEWCGPCRMISPIVDKLAEQYEGQVIIGKCDVDEENAVATKYGVRNIPTLIFIKNGEIVDKQVGAAPQPTLEAKIKALL